MNEWQRGIDLETLRSFAQPFKARHKSLVFGAFGLVKERDVAEALAEKRIAWSGKPPQAVAIYSVLQNASQHQDFAQRQYTVPAGTLVLKSFAATDGLAGARVLRVMRERHAEAKPMLVEVFEEDDLAKGALRATGSFEHLATKISAGSEIKGVYASRGHGIALAPLAPEDEATLLVVEREFLSADEHAAICAELEAFASLWAQHYSNYNKRKSWEAFALRGFDDDPSFVIKPVEMSKAWKEENAARLADKPRFTHAAANFPATLEFVSRFAPPERCNRIRFMRLRAKDGELARHADIVDKDAGTANGKLSRMHIPIRTSEAVRFQGWSARGERVDMTMPERALCYLDQRKPHACTNSDPALNRIHLVVDAEASPALRERIARALAPMGWPDETTSGELARRTDSFPTPPAAARAPAGLKAVKVSAAMARLQFIQCGPNCIATGCTGKCCDAPGLPSGCMVTIHHDERFRIEARGGKVQDGFLQPREGERGCPFKSGGLCSLHETPDKPFGCIASPFTLNSKFTLIVRNRYRLLPCYMNDGPREPAYRAFAGSLALLFGEQEAARIAAHLDAGGGDLVAMMPAAHARMLSENDDAKRRKGSPGRAAAPGAKAEPQPDQRGA